MTPFLEIEIPEELLNPMILPDRLATVPSASIVGPPMVLAVASARMPVALPNMLLIELVDVIGDNLVARALFDRRRRRRC